MINKENKINKNNNIFSLLIKKSKHNALPEFLNSLKIRLL